MRPRLPSDKQISDALAQMNLFYISARPTRDYDPEDWFLSWDEIAITRTRYSVTITPPPKHGLGHCYDFGRNLWQPGLYVTYSKPSVIFSMKKL